MRVYAPLMNDQAHYRLGSLLSFQSKIILVPHHMQMRRVGPLFPQLLQSHCLQFLFSQQKQQLAYSFYIIFHLLLNLLF